MQKKKIQYFLSLALIVMFMLNLTGCNQPSSTPVAQAAATRTIKDMAGRTVTVPVTIKTAFATSPVGSIMLYALAPDKLVGWNYDLRPTERKYILPKYRSLPNLGGWYAKNTGNTEELLKIHPDVLIDMGDITNTEISLADKIQQQLGIPVVMVNADPVTKMDQAIDFMGDFLGEKARSQELADYCRNTVADVTAKAAQIPQEKRLKVYYAEGANGLQTDPKGSTHVETLDLVGGINVGNVALTGGAGMTSVSMEQVLSWNSDVILVWNKEQGGYYPGILSDPKWQGIKAVQQHRVYEIPDAPFNWFDRPPSINRIIGFKWLGHLLYPDVFNYDMVKEVKEFYTQFYHYNLSDVEAKTLLAGTPAQ